VQYEPKGLPDLLFFRLGLGIEYGDEGIRLSQKALKWRAKLEEVINDSRNHQEALPSDLFKIFAILTLLALDESGSTYVPDEFSSKWEESWKSLCRFTEGLNDILALKKKKGRPTSMDAVLIDSFVAITHKLNRTGYNQEAGQYWNYLWLLFSALKARLEKSEEYKKRKTGFERVKIREREFKAAKTAVDRAWRGLNQGEPPNVEKDDKQAIKAWVVGDFSQAQQFIQRFRDKFYSH
jgi:hypothetical protein